MNAELSRRLGTTLGSHIVKAEDRARILAAAAQVETWDELPAEIQRLVERIDAEVEE